MSSGVNVKCQNANLHNLQLGLIYKHILHTNHLIFNFNTHCQVFKQGYKNGQNINANFFTKLLLLYLPDVTITSLLLTSVCALELPILCC